jgi:DNA (cytosine-5)-methyltransferase 1
MSKPKAKVYGLVGKSSNSWKTETARTLDTKGGDPTCNQGGNIVVYPDVARSLTARYDSSPCIDRGQNHITECGNVAPTVAAKYGTGGNNTPLVAYSLDRTAYNQGQNAQFQISVQEEQAQTLVAKGPHAVAQPYTVGNGQADNLYIDEKARTLNCMHDQQIALMARDGIRYIVRRLTPLECCRLQGYPDYWAQDLVLTDIEEKYLARWAKKARNVPKRIRKRLNRWIAVFEFHRRATEPDKKPKTRNQIRKWLTEPHSDSAEYKMWGNSLAIPCAYTVLAGIADELKTERQSELDRK